MVQINNNDSYAVLIKQQHQSWLKFTDRHPDSFHHLNPQQLADFKQAITLSDFIFDSAMQCPDLILDLFNSDCIYQKKLPNYAKMLQLLLNNCATEIELQQILRRFRRQQMVNIAVADLVLNISLEHSLLRLSTLADTLIMAALNWLMIFCQQQWGKPQSASIAATDEALPLLVYGMGKLGGKELNFSSDIDLIFVYPESGETVGVRRSIDNQQFFTRLAQRLIAALHTVTPDGFVYRVDMRLRPFGESGPLVLSFNAMEDYYQNQGRDWERYAMLKARLIGNSKYHGQLSNMLRPFVYRRYIDFSVIESLRRMKTMIAQEVRRKQLKNNIKLGAGGIREIEFIVQVFQLIRGGRIVALQQRRLLTVLPILVEKKVISEQSSRALKNAYCFLRRVENAIQAIGDQQTQTLPENSLDQERILSVLGLTDWTHFLLILQNHTQAVHQEFNQLIGEDSPNHQAKDHLWQTWWHALTQLNTESEHSNKQEIIIWLEELAVTWQSAAVVDDLFDFHLSVHKGGIGRRGAQILDKLIPFLLWHLVQADQNDETLKRVLIVLKKISTRTAYLELLYENEGALKHLIRLCQASYWIAEQIAKYPILLDELIDPKLLHNPPSLDDYGRNLRELMLRIPEDDLETQMDVLRQFKQAQHLRIAAGDIVDVLPLVEVSDHLTALAQAIIGEVIVLAWQHVVARFGEPQFLSGRDNKGFAAIGYGKLGGCELSYSSDLDLVFVHNSPQNDTTTGENSVASSHFYVKLVQRIMHIFNTRMSSGVLYELDMRLRPSGNSGVLVTHINTFAQYQTHDAWTWEHQALVRARIVYGNNSLNEQFNTIRKNVLSMLRDAQQLQQDVITMRTKMRKHLDKSTADFFDIKQGNGGLVDIEFLVQYLVLRYSINTPSIACYSDNISLLEQLTLAHILSVSEQRVLSESYIQLRDLGHRATIQNQLPQLTKRAMSKVIGVKRIYDCFL